MAVDLSQGSVVSFESEFLAYWQALPREGAVPTLAAFLDHPNPRFAPWVNIVDVVSEDCLNVRLFGTRMVESFGELTGLNFLDFMSHDARRTVGRAHGIICETPCGWLTHASAVTTTGRVVIPATIRLPLLHNGLPRSVVKFAQIVQEQEYGRDEVKVEWVKADRWIDLGAGTPSPDTLS